jgi:AcrR family transcriptional regulator
MEAVNNQSLPQCSIVDIAWRFVQDEEPIMTEKTMDRRIQRTRKLLQDALLELIIEKGYDEITVQDVIDRANVGRSTFYAHFQDKEDLFLSEFEMLRSQFEEHLADIPMPDASPWGLSLMMFYHAQSQHQLYKALAGKQAGGIALGHIQRYFTALLRDHLRPQFSRKQDQIPAEILAHFLVSSFLSLLTWWLDHNMPYSAERMNEMFRQLTQPGVEAVL